MLNMRERTDTVPRRAPTDSKRPSSRLTSSKPDFNTKMALVIRNNSTPLARRRYAKNYVPCHNGPDFLLAVIILFFYIFYLALFIFY